MQIPVLPRIDTRARDDGLWAVSRQDGSVASLIVSFYLYSNVMPCPWLKQLMRTYPGNLGSLKHLCFGTGRNAVPAILLQFGNPASQHLLICDVSRISPNQRAVTSGIGHTDETLGEHLKVERRLQFGKDLVPIEQLSFVLWSASFRCLYLRCEPYFRVSC